MQKFIMIFLAGTLVGWLAVDRLQPSPHQRSSEPADNRALHDTASRPPGNLDAAEGSNRKKKEPARTQIAAPQDKPLQPSNQDDTRTDSAKKIDFAAIMAQEVSVDGNSEMAGPLLRLWSVRQPAEAFDWLTGRFSSGENMQGNAPLDPQALDAALAAYMDHDMDAAGRAVQSLAPGGLRSTMMSRYVELLAQRQGAAEAKAWLEASGNPEDLRSGFDTLAQAMAAEDHHGFVYYLDENRDRLVSEDNDSAVDGPVAMAGDAISWDILLPGQPINIAYAAEELAFYPEAAQSSIARGLISRVMSETPDDVNHLLDALPQGHVRDDAVVNYLSHIDVETGPLDHHRLADLAAAIEDPEKKRQAATSLLSSCYGENPGGKNNSTDQAPANGDSVRNRLLALIETPSP